MARYLALQALSAAVIDDDDEELEWEDEVGLDDLELDAGRPDDGGAAEVEAAPQPPAGFS